MRYRLTRTHTKNLDLSYYMPGSKSFTNRALIMAAITKGLSTLRSYSKSDDSLSMVNALRSLGIEITSENHALQVKGGSFSKFKGELDIGPAGTTMRFLTALCAALPGTDVVLKGSERMHERPIKPLVDSLILLGADIEYLGQTGCPPLRVKGKTLTGTELSMQGELSSQYFSALMLISPLISGNLIINVIGEQFSKSYIDMTIASMQLWGKNIENKQYSQYLEVDDKNYSSTDYLVEGDASGASYLWALAALTKGKVKVYGIPKDSIQGDARFPILLKEMGCTIEYGLEDRVPWISVEGAKLLKGITIDMQNMPDTAQTLAMVAAVAVGDTTITGLETLAHKETDRIKAVVNELAKLGVNCKSDVSSLIVSGADQLSSGVISTYEDHRMAMSFALLASSTSELFIEEPLVVNKSFPEFWDLMKEAGFKIEEV